MQIVILSPAHRPPFEPPQGPIAVSQSVNQACCFLGGPRGSGGLKGFGVINSLWEWALKSFSQAGFLVGAPHGLNQADRYQLQGGVINRYQSLSSVIKSVDNA